MKQLVVFLVNGGPESAMGIRARSFAERLPERFDSQIQYRTGSKFTSLWRFLAALLRLRPEACYVLDLAYSGTIAGVVAKLLVGTPLCVDTGDAIYELAKATGRGPVGLLLTKGLEWIGHHASDRLIVRSHFHQEWLAARGLHAAVIPDGVDVKQFSCVPDPALRRRLGLEGFHTVGILGSLTWNPRTNSCYGMEVLEVLRRLPDLAIKGVIIGDGDGRNKLERWAESHGIADRVVFLGRLPYEELPAALSTIDVCVSTQTDDLPGRVRTTGKLPLYLAAGRNVLATAVGEAVRVLPSEFLIAYRGSWDETYPARLAVAVERTLKHPLDAAKLTALAEQHFSYDRLAQQVSELLPQRSSVTKRKERFVD